MTETAMLVLTAVNVAIVLYALIIDRLEKAAARAREWRGQFSLRREETRHNLGIIAALEREDLNNNEIQNPAIRTLISQLCCDQSAAVDYEFFTPLKKRRARRRRSGSACLPAIDAARAFSLVRDTARKIAALTDRAEQAEEAALNAPRTLLAPPHRGDPHPPRRTKRRPGVVTGGCGRLQPAPFGLERYSSRLKPKGSRWRLKSSGPRPESSAPWLGSSRPRLQSFMPGNPGFLPGNNSSIPGYKTFTPGYKSSIPGCETFTPGYNRSIPGYKTLTPRNAGSIPGGFSMNFTGIDLHTNRFTCCYRTERDVVDDPKDRHVQTFELTGDGLAAFYATLIDDTYVLVEAAITACPFVRLFKDRVKAAVIANTCELKQISLARNNTDKPD